MPPTTEFCPWKFQKFYLNFLSILTPFFFFLAQNSIRKLYFMHIPKFAWTLMKGGIFGLSGQFFQVLPHLKTEYSPQKFPPQKKLWKTLCYVSSSCALPDRPRIKTKLPTTWIESTSAGFWYFKVTLQNWSSFWDKLLAIDALCQVHKFHSPNYKCRGIEFIWNKPPIVLWKWLFALLGTCCKWKETRNDGQKKKKKLAY